MNTLPNEMVVHLGSFLGVKETCTLSSTCSELHALLTDVRAKWRHRMMFKKVLSQFMKKKFKKYVYRSYSIKLYIDLSISSKYININNVNWYMFDDDFIIKPIECNYLGIVLENRLYDIDIIAKYLIDEIFYNNQHFIRGVCTNNFIGEYHYTCEYC